MTSIIPGPKGRWLIGDTLTYEQDRIGWLHGAWDTYGDIVQLAPKVVVIYHPAEIQRVLASPDAVPGHAAMTGGRSLTSTLPQWTQTRRALWHELDRSFVAAHLGRIQAAFSARVQSSSGTSKEVLGFATRMCAEAAVDLCAGADGVDDELADATLALQQQLVQGSVVAEPRVRWLPRPVARRTARASAELTRKLAAVLQRRRAAGYSGPPRDLADAIELPVTDAAETLRAVLMASPGSPGAAVAWAMLRLAERPAVDADAYAKEVLRMHPPTWLLVRHVLRPMAVAGHILSPGTEVLIPVYHVHRDPRWWQRPGEFDPARWSRPVPHSPHAYLAFGSGPRLCPGGHLAMAQLAAAIHAFAGYKLSLTGGTPEPSALLVPAGLSGSWSASQWSASNSGSR
ncbi:cytochrome P450 [Catelliglobosispora koreensis]|uniref:cytochrome P450 n=1 Tax=Catelliglobosispora koreensis TaxID=129052 RepID=UPI00036EF380|nr:cytochrome P450 [Catelliglobosispora koreensis]